MGEIGLAAKSVIAVGSGKGGVGKSTIAASLAYGLTRAGCQVGLMDADVYGPSIPHLIGSSERPRVLNNRIQPVMVDGLTVMSMGFLVPPGEAVVGAVRCCTGPLPSFSAIPSGVAGLPDHRHAAGHGRYRLDAFALLAVDRGRRGLHAAGRGAAGRGEGDRHVPQGEHRRAGDGGEHEPLHLPAVSCPPRHLRLRRRPRKAAELGVPFLGEVPLNTQLRIYGDQGRVVAGFDDENSASYLEALGYNLVKGLAVRHRQKPPMPTLSVLG